VEEESVNKTRQVKEATKDQIIPLIWVKRLGYETMEEESIGNKNKLQQRCRIP
jgi:hypothetical protein